MHIHQTQGLRFPCNGRTGEVTIKLLRLRKKTLPTIESLAILYVRGRPVHVSSARNREKRLTIWSAVCPLQILAILKCHNSMFVTQINSPMQKFSRRRFILLEKTTRFRTKVNSCEKSPPHNSV